ncbi:MAG: triose-phosphate isomerase [Chloroflexota bacterium]|nr:triose-phosphate isomerase [Chloroflexota bacterium]
MRKPMMAGNWKMNKTVAEAVALAQAIDTQVAQYNNVDCVICPTALCLQAVQQTLQNSPVRVGAQNVHWADGGAYTGEISAPMLKGLADYVLIGHSERRQYFGETDETVNKKLHATLAHNLTPIVCVGETLAQNQAGQTHAIVSMQVQEALKGLTAEQVQTLVVAYEPIWAIGTGLAATAEQAGQICGVVRTVIGELCGAEVAENTRILYGGSTNEKNIGEIMQQAEIDGALIGGAALKVESYATMVQVTSELYK